MIRQFSLAVLVFLITGCGGSDLPPRYDELQRMFKELEPDLIEIEREMERDHLWQLVPHYIDGSSDEAHIPELTSSQTTKYKNLLGLVPAVDYVDKTDDLTDFSMGSVTTDGRTFIFQIMHTTRRARPTNCDESPLDDTIGVCSTDLGNNWALWIMWHEISNGEG